MVSLVVDGGGGVVSGGIGAVSVAKAATLPGAAVGDATTSEGLSGVRSQPANAISGMMIQICFIPPPAFRMLNSVSFLFNFDASYLPRLQGQAS